MKKTNFRQVAVWTAALALGVALGALGIPALDDFFAFVSPRSARGAAPGRSSCTPSPTRC